jgi:hypothetical protein
MYDVHRWTLASISARDVAEAVMSGQPGIEADLVDYEYNDWRRSRPDPSGTSYNFNYNNALPQPESTESYADQIRRYMQRGPRRGATKK